MTVRKIKAVYAYAGEFGVEEKEAVLITEDIVFDRYDNSEVVFFLLDEPVKENQDVVNIDRVTCTSFMLHGYFGTEDNRLDKLGYDWIAKASLLDFIREYAVVYNDLK
jgi:hypothetical protein